jgi:hypothetical protein
MGALGALIILTNTAIDNQKNPYYEFKKETIENLVSD